MTKRNSGIAIAIAYFSFVSLSLGRGFLNPYIETIPFGPVGSNIAITLIQVGMTTLLGLIFCLFREAFKRFHMLSLIVLHGIYNAALPLFTAVFSR